MKFPVKVRYRNIQAKIYKPGKFAYYRLAYSVGGKRHILTFKNYSDAKTAGDKIVRELASGSEAARLNASQAREALSALAKLDNHYKIRGQRIGLELAIADYLNAIEKLTVPLSVAIDGYLNTVVVVKR